MPTLDKFRSHVYYLYMNKPADINQTLPAYLINIGKHVTQITDDRLNAVGLSNAKLLALHAIGTSTDGNVLATVTCLADMMSTSKSNITAMVDRLIAEGLVTRKRSSEDRRVVVIALTKEGQKRYLAGAAVIQELHVELSTQLSEEEQIALKQLIGKLPSR